HQSACFGCDEALGPSSLVTRRGREKPCEWLRKTGCGTVELCSRLWRLAHQRDVALRIELASGGCAGHVADLAEDLALTPRPVELAGNGPGNPGVGGRIAPVEFIGVVEQPGPLVGLRWARR